MAGVKFDAFDDGGNLQIGDKIVGLRANENTQFDFPSDGIEDGNGNFLVKWTSLGGSATNYLNFVNGQSGIPTKIIAEGTEADVDIDIEAKGTGKANVKGLFSVNGSIEINSIIDDDTMATASDTNVPTAESVVSYIAGVPSTAGGADTQIQYNNAGFLNGDTGFTTDGAGSLTLVGDFSIDNINIDGNTISSIDLNGDIILSPDGIGSVSIDNLSFNGNTIVSTDLNGDISILPNGSGSVLVDNLGLSGNTLASTDTNGNINLSAHGTGIVAVDNIGIDGNTISSTDTDGDINLSPDGVGAVNVTTTLNLNASTAVDEIIDDDTMATATATNLATAESIVAYIASQLPPSTIQLQKTFLLEYNNTYLTIYRNRSITGGGNYDFTFSIPTDFVSLVGLYMVATPLAAGSAGAGKSITLDSAYGGNGESTTLHTENDTVVIDTGTQDVFFQLDVSSVFTSIAAGDTCGLMVSHNAVGASIGYFTIELIYNRNL